MSKKPQQVALKATGKLKPEPEAIPEKKFTPNFPSMADAGLPQRMGQQTIIDSLKDLFPHGHPDFLPAVIEEMRLHSEKNHDYASCGDPLGNFDRVSAILAMYPGFPFATPHGIAIVYALKQVDAVLWGLAQNIDHKVEGLHGRFQDVSVYMKLADIMTKK